MLARALRGAWRPHMRGLVEPMIMTGLTDALVRALRVSLEPEPNVESMVYRVGVTKMASEIPAALAVSDTGVMSTGITP